MAKKKSFKDEWLKDPLIILGVVTSIIIAPFVLMFSSDKPKTEEKPVAHVQEAPKPKATYEATVINYGAPDPATLTAVVQLRNTNNLEGNPSCMVEAKSTNGTYHGTGSFDLERTVPAGGEDQFIGKLTITKEGSAYITDVTATCGV